MSERSATIGLTGSSSAVLWSAKLDGNKERAAHATVQDPELLSRLCDREVATFTIPYLPRTSGTTDSLSLNLLSG